MSRQNLKIVGGGETVDLLGAKQNDSRVARQLTARGSHWCSS